MGLISKLDRFLEDKNYQIIIKENQVNFINFNEEYILHSEPCGFLAYEFEKLFLKSSRSEVIQ